MKQRTCILIKPDGLNKKAVGKIIARFESEHFELLAIKMIHPNKNLIENFYSIHKGKPFFPAFIDFMLSDSWIAMVWEGENLIVRSRKIIGATDSQQAEEGSLRKTYGTDQRMNLVHSSDSEASAEREIQILFNAEELRTVSEALKI